MRKFADSLTGSADYGPIVRGLIEICPLGKLERLAKKWIKVILVRSPYPRGARSSCLSWVLADPVHQRSRGFSRSVVPRSHLDCWVLSRTIRVGTSNRAKRFTSTKKSSAATVAPDMT